VFNLERDAVDRRRTYSPIPTIREFGNQIVAESAHSVDLNPRRLYQLATEGSDLLMALSASLDLITARSPATISRRRSTFRQLSLMIRRCRKSRIEFLFRS
jgi:hypothetical protein